MPCESKTLLTGTERQRKVRQDLYKESGSIALSAGPSIPVILLPVQEGHVHDVKILHQIPSVRDINSYFLVILI